jgi:hypothetical protein
MTSEKRLVQANRLMRDLDNVQRLMRVYQKTHDGVTLVLELYVDSSGKIKNGYTEILSFSNLAEASTELLDIIVDDIYKI